MRYRPPISEKAFQRRVRDLAARTGWKCVHIRSVEIAPGRYSVPYEGDSGMPDLLLAKGGRVLLVELKTDTGRVTKDQQAWLDAAGVNGAVWRPSAWGEVVAVLTGKAAA